MRSWFLPPYSPDVDVNELSAVRQLAHCVFDSFLEELEGS